MMQLNDHSMTRRTALVTLLCVAALVAYAPRAYADEPTDGQDEIPVEAVTQDGADDEGVPSVPGEEAETDAGDISQHNTNDCDDTIGGDEKAEVPDGQQVVAVEEADGPTDAVAEDGTMDVTTDGEAEPAGDPAPAAAGFESTESLAATGTTGSMEATAQGTLDGVDISGHNALINIAKLDADFVIIKATEWNPDTKTYTSYTTNRTSNTYASYLAQADAALAAGKLIGFYHFATNPSMGASWTQQAQGFIDAVKGYLGQAILVLDWEDTSYSKVESNVAGAKAWLDYVYQQTGIRPLIYMNKSCTNSSNWSSVQGAGYELWGAQYADVKHHTGYSSSPWQSSEKWGAWGSRPTIFQYSSTTTVTGSGGAVDVNVFYGTKDDWHLLAGGGETGEPGSISDGAVYSFVPAHAGSSLLVSNVGGNAQLGSSTNSLAGYWRAVSMGDGYYSFVSLADGSMLSFSGPAGNRVDVGAHDGADVTEWRLVKCYSGALALVPKGYDGYRLDVTGGKVSVDGTNIELYAMNDLPWQRFFFTKAIGLSEAVALGETVEGGMYAICSSIVPNKSLDIHGGSAANSANVEVYTPKAVLWQRFALEYQGNGLYRVRVLSSGKYLDVSGASRESGANVIQYAGRSGLNQLWSLRPSGSGYAFVSALSGMVLDVWKSGTANGTNIQVYRSNGGDNQRFLLVRETPLDEAASAGRPLPDGVYSIASAMGSNLVVDVAGASKANCGDAIVYQKKGGLNQKFELSYVGCGLYTIRATHSGKVLDVAGASTSSGANVIQYARGTNSLNQLWYLESLGDGFAIKSALTGMSLDVRGGVARSGASLQVYESHGRANQCFTLSETPLLDDGDYFMISALSPSLAVEVKGKSVTKGANVQIGAYKGNASQHWRLTYVGDGLYKVVNVLSGLALDVSGASTQKGANIEQWTVNGGANQLWSLTVNDDGSIGLRSACSGLALDVTGGAAKAGTNVEQWTPNGTRAQGFNLITGGDLDAFVSRMVYYCKTASVGYSQGKNRYNLYDGGECDCSSLVIGCLKEAGFAVGSANSTRDIRKNLTANGWTIVSWSMASVRTGDILLCEGYHVCAVVSGSGTGAKVAEAWLNELGTISGGVPGDQTGQETRVRNVYSYPYGGGWTCILRYAA